MSCIEALVGLSYVEINKDELMKPRTKYIAIGL